MTISTEVQKVVAPGNGSATVFSFSPTPIFASSNLVVTLIDAVGAETVLVEGTGAGNYSVNVAAYPGTGSINYPASGATRLQTGEKLVIERVLPLTQLVDLENQGGYFPDTLEEALDRNVAMIQQQQDDLNRSLKSSPADGAMGLLPSAAVRANQLLTFDANGDPSVAAPTSATVSATMQPVVAAASTDAALVLLKGERVFVTIAALRSNTDANVSAVRVKNYASLADKGGGFFVKQDTDTTSPDDGGFVIVDAGGRRWYRDMGASNMLTLEHFGVFPQAWSTSVTDQSAQIQKWIDRVGTTANCIGYAAEGTYGVASTIYWGNGSTVSLSTKCNGSTFIFAGAGAMADPMINTSSIIQKSGVIFKWVGSDGGTLATLQGPLSGMRWVGAPTFDGSSRTPGAAGASNCVSVYGVQNSKFDGIHSYNWRNGGIGIALNALAVTNIAGDFGTPATAHNQFGSLIAFSPYATASYAISMDGYRAASGSDTTVCTVDLMEVGFNLDGSKGLVLGFVDNVTINHFLGITYGTPGAQAYGIYLDNNATPFATPNQIRIIHCTAGGSVGIGGSTGGSVWIDEYTLDDGSTVPTGITGLKIDRLLTLANANIDGTPIMPERRAQMSGNNQGFVGRDTAGAFIAALTRANGQAHVSSMGDIEFECTTATPSTNTHFKMGQTYFRPTNDNAVQLGGPSNRWTTVYATTGAINTSDGNQKKMRGVLTSPEMAAWARVSPVLFKFQDAVAAKGEAAARLHMGLVAQEVAEAFAAEGLDAGNYALWCKDTVNGQDVLGLRYDECWAFEAAYQRDRATRSEARLAALEGQIATMLNRVAAVEAKK